MIGFDLKLLVLLFISLESQLSCFFPKKNAGEHTTDLGLHNYLNNYKPDWLNLIASYS
jgi:hypothetical protein